MSREQELEAARNEMVKTFWYVTKCCEGPYLGRPKMNARLSIPCAYDLHVSFDV